MTFRLFIRRVPTAPIWHATTLRTCYRTFGTSRSNFAAAVKKALDSRSKLGEVEVQKKNAEPKPPKKTQRFTVTSIDQFTVPSVTAPAKPPKVPKIRKTKSQVPEEDSVAVGSTKAKRATKEKPVPGPVDPTALPGYSDEHCVLAIDPGTSNLGFALLTCSGHLLRWENVALFGKNTTFDAGDYAAAVFHLIHRILEKDLVTTGGTPKSLSIVIEKQHLVSHYYTMGKVRSVECILWGVLRTMHELDHFRERLHRNVVTEAISPKAVAARFEISKKCIEQKVAQGVIEYRPKKSVTVALSATAAYTLKKWAGVQIVAGMVTGDPETFRPTTGDDTSMQKIFCSPDQLHSFWTAAKKDDWADVILMAVHRMEQDLKLNMTENI